MKDHPRGGSYAFPATFTVLVALVLGVAGLYVWSQLPTHRWLARAPRASLAAPREGPAVYAGELVGPRDRATPSGTPAAAHWFWVDQLGSKGKRTTACFQREVRGVALVGDLRSAPLAFLETDASLSLLSDERTNDWADRLVVDLGATPRLRGTDFPAAAAHCAASGRDYTERWIPAGARAEVLACHRAGALVPCDGPLAAVVSLPELRVHRARRAEDDMGPFRVAATIAFVLLFIAGIHAIYVRATTLDVLRPGRRA